jgi:23S rRNA (uracil1939-C5)-methyltransferase
LPYFVYSSTLVEFYSFIEIFMANTSRNRIVELTVTEFSKKGNGIALYERPGCETIPVEVPFTMPGDHVQVRLLRKRGGVYLGRLEELLKGSPERISPRCAHFGVCGGCRFQHLSQDKQTHYKEQFIREAFAKVPSLPIGTIRPLIIAEEAWHYRNKMEYSFSSDLSGQKYLGLVMDSSKGRVFNMTECYLTQQWFVDAVKAVKRWWEPSGLDAYHMRKDTGSLRTLTLREGLRTGDRMVVLTVSGNPQFAVHRQQLDAFVACLRAAIDPPTPDSRLSIFLRIQQIAKGQPTNMYEMVLYGPDHLREILYISTNHQKAPQPLFFNVGPASFFQPNTRQAEKIYSTALQMAQIPSDAIVYDLYCGTGTLGLCIAKHVKEVIGIEISLESALDARTNIERNQCHNMRVISGSVRDILQRSQEQQLPLPDVVMVDPPRSGLDKETISHLLKMAPATIVYISCNPLAQADNVLELLQNGYRIEAIQPIDQFPQTYHIENIVILVKIPLC